MRKNRMLGLVFSATLLSACGGGGNSASSAGTAPPPPQPTPDSGCTGACANAQTFLGVSDVQTIIAQAAAEAQAQGKPAVIAVVDRVGNVLAVYRMNGAPDTMTITSGRNVVGGLEGLAVPSELAAIAKAVTGAYLSSEGNAFSTRTASQIIQEHFNPGVLGTPAGPLFGVQFSQLPCSDLTTHFTAGTGAGPHNSPLGLSADPGGFPLYKSGTPVGGIGVAADGIYGLDPNVMDKDRNIDELIAMAGTYGFGAPADRRADTVTAGGITLRFSDVGYSDLATHPQSAPPYSALTGALMTVPGYFDGSAILAGTAFGQIASGIRPDDAYYPGLDAFVLDDGHGNNRYPPIAGSDGANALTAHEVQTIEQQALTIANRARAQIRNPLGSQARVTVSIVDTNGVALAIARTRDAPVFGIDVSLQKARTAAFNSGSYAADSLQALAPANYFADSIDVADKKATFTTVAQSHIGDYVSAVRTFLGMPDALTGNIAFTDRAGGNLSRPFFPDGIDGTPNGPFSHPYPQWSPFQEGLQLDLVYNAVALNLVGYLNAQGFAISADNVPATTQYCTASPRLANGIQVFPGSVPIYRGNVLVGGLGVSGDGVDQDDMVSFLGLYNAGIALNGTIGNAPTAIRADNLAPQGVHLRYVQCPQAPFLDSNADNVCDGK
ncbi:MAG: heme-binding protein [Xanthomonadaceae bacterium]|nr:heme-binding protein [Xanthomonadaceae bacterium]